MLSTPYKLTDGLIILFPLGVFFRWDLWAQGRAEQWQEREEEGSCEEGHCINDSGQRCQVRKREWITESQLELSYNLSILDQKSIKMLFFFLVLCSQMLWIVCRRTTWNWKSWSTSTWWTTLRVNQTWPSWLWTPLLRYVLSALDRCVKSKWNITVFEYCRNTVTSKGLKKVS